MPSMQKAIKLALALAPVFAMAAPKPGMTIHPRIVPRQVPAAMAGAAPAAAPAAAAAQPLSDVDILQFALTAENLESTFYAQGFQKFPDSDFMALGLTQNNVNDLKMVGMTESTHVTALMSAIAQAGAQPVQACNYNFQMVTDATTMVSTARVLEAVGIAAYLGAAPLINSSAVLGTAATIATVEARHQTLLRLAGGQTTIPSAFDTPLGPRAVFTLVAPFIASCPTGSNLNIQAFPSIALSGGNSTVTSGQSLVLQDAAQPAGAMFCAFMNAGTTPQFTQLTAGGCSVPGNLAGEAFMMITSQQAVTDDVVLAGPAVLTPS